MHPSHDPLTRWLAAERDGLTDEAEELLLELFEADALPRLAPPAGFADRVLARVAVEAAVERAAVPVQPGFSLFRRGWLRWVIALCLLATGLSVAWLPQTVAVFAGLWSPAGFLQSSIRAVLDAIRWMASLADVGQTLLAVAEAVALSLARPQVMVIALVCLVVSVTSFRFLRGLVSRDRSWAYVDPI